MRDGIPKYIVSTTVTIFVTLVIRRAIAVVMFVQVRATDCDPYTALHQAVFDGSRVCWATPLVVRININVIAVARIIMQRHLTIVC
jgi:hypothetical protein